MTCQIQKKTKERSKSNKQCSDSGLIHSTRFDRFDTRLASKIGAFWYMFVRGGNGTLLLRVLQAPTGFWMRSKSRESLFQGVFPIFGKQAIPTKKKHRLVVHSFLATVEANNPIGHKGVILTDGCYSLT